jgi:hypothetical protein
LKDMNKDRRRIGILRPEPAEALHCLGNALLIAGNNLAQVLRVHARRECCRTDKVRKHHGDLAALGRVLTRFSDNRAFAIVSTRSSAMASSSFRRTAPKSRRRKPAKLLTRPHEGIAFNQHYTCESAAIFKHACALGCEGIVSKRLGSSYRSGRVDHWLKIKNPAAPAVRREAEEDWGRKRHSR